MQQHVCLLFLLLHCSYVVRLSCGGCGLAVLQQLFQQAADSSLLQHTALLLLDLQLPPLHLPAASSDTNTADTAGCHKDEQGEPVYANAVQMQAAAGMDAAAAALGQSCAADFGSASKADGSCSDQDRNDGDSTNCSGTSSSSSCELHNNGSSASGLAAVYNLLHQQHGFVGLLRQQLPCGIVRLGWVRQPAQIPAAAAASGRGVAADVQL
jgi:hypothetical protein